MHAYYFALIDLIEKWNFNFVQEPQSSFPLLLTLISFMFIFMITDWCSSVESWFQIIDIKIFNIW